jgi:hypothetical protein
MAGEPELIKVRLTDEGEDSETPWAEDLGPAPGPRGARRVRLINVPFMHAKPTWGDVIIVVPVEDDFPLWDRGGVAWDQIGSRIAEDGGRWAMIVDYAPHGDSEDAYVALVHACAELEIVCEGAWGPRDGKPGRAYLAVKHELDDVAVMTRLRDALPCELIQIHPQPEVSSVPHPAAPRVEPSRPVPAQPASKPTSSNAVPAKPGAKLASSKTGSVQPGSKLTSAKTAPAQPTSKSASSKAAPAKHSSKPDSSKVAAAKSASKARASVTPSAKPGSKMRVSATPSAKPAAKVASSKGAASKAAASRRSSDAQRRSKAPTKVSKPAAPAKPTSATASRTKRR